MNLDLKYIIREGYYLLDLLSDLGGLYGLLFSVLSFALTYTNFNYLDNYLSAKLFKLENEHYEEDDEDGDSRLFENKEKTKKSTFVKPARVSTIKALC